MKNLSKNLFVLLLVAITVFSCKKKDDPKPQNPDDKNEEELITTLKLVLTEVSSNAVSTFQYKDVDGPGGNAPIQDNIVLSANKTYNGKIILLDETKNPVDTISKEVKEEADEHQFFFTISGANITHSYKSGDVDSKGVPLGLEPIFTTTGASTGTLKVILKHQPEVKPTSGSGDVTKGETDIEVIFNVTIN